MGKRKINFNLILSLAVTLAAFLLGGPGVMMAAVATDLEGGGTTSSGDESQSGNQGVQGTGVTQEIMEGEDNREYVMNDVEKEIVKSRPQKTPLDNISRYGKVTGTSSWACKYYSIGTRPFKTTLTADVAAQSSGLTTVLQIADTQMFSKDDTIRVVGVKAITDDRGVAYNAKDPKTPDLVLLVTGVDSNTGNPTVCAVNGKADANGKAVWLPAIPKGTVLMRMAKSCGEFAAQTGRFFNLPSPDIQYCQNMMIQVEQGNLDKLQKKEVPWTMSDQEEDALYDFRYGKELTSLFGSKATLDTGLDKDGKRWFTKGIYWMADKDIEIGHATGGAVSIDDKDLVDFAKDAFTGPGSGNTKKILFCGSELLAMLSKIDSEVFRMKENHSQWNLEFRSWKTDFGEILTIQDEMFDYMGLSDHGFLLDPAYLRKRTFLPFTQSALDLKKAGVRNTDAQIMQEVSCLYLRYPKAHARVSLKKA